MEEPKLRFLARGRAMVPDYGALHDQRRRAFHGWKHDPTLGPKFIDPATKQEKRHGGFVRQANQVIEVAEYDPHLAEYIRHLRDGDLWPADAYTAAFTRRPFDPTFGGEHDPLPTTQPAADKAAAE